MDWVDPWGQQIPGETHSGYDYPGDGSAGISCGGSYGTGAALEYPFQPGDGGFSPFDYPNTTYSDAFRSPGNSVSGFGSPVEYCQTPNPYHQQTLTPGGYSTSQHQRHARYLQYQQPPYETQGKESFQEFQPEHEYPVYGTFSRPGSHVCHNDNDAIGDESNSRHPSLRLNKYRRLSKANDSGALLSPVSIESPVSSTGNSTSAMQTAADTGTLPRSRQQQYERTRQKNREAASKCREKTKRNVEDLRKHERELSCQKQVLTALAAELKEEVLALKHEILMHGNCECEHIQKYLSTAAKQIA